MSETSKETFLKVINEIKGKKNGKNENNENNKIIIEKNKENDQTFNKLLELQLLIKKESGLTELCK